MDGVAFAKVGDLWLRLDQVQAFIGVDGPCRATNVFLVGGQIVVSNVDATTFAVEINKALEKRNV